MDLYRKVALSQVPRALGLGDRDPASETFGCFDRAYWHYKVLDFANARFQEAAWLLALLYTNGLPGNRYYDCEVVRDWAMGAVAFWAKIQRCDGSFDEVYPFEHSFVATAFSTYAVTEAMLILDWPSHLDHVERAGRWLVRHDNRRVANQMAGACAALYNVYLLTGQEVFRRAATDKCQRLLTMQDTKGFFLEYGGFDIGYLSVGLSYLVRYWRKTGDDALWKPIQRGIAFVEERIRPDGSYDCSATSRHTQYLYPYGFCVEEGRMILERHLAGLGRDVVVSPAWMDDRFFIPLTIDYLVAYLESGGR